MLAYIMGLAAAGLVGSLVFQGHSEKKDSPHVQETCSPDLSDYQIPSIAEQEERELAHH